MTAHEQERQKRFAEFLTWFKTYCNGKERAQGQIFFNKFLQAFGNAGILEAGAVCEDTIKKKSGKTGFADLVWRPRVIIELKERGTNLKKHYSQAEEYWMRLVPNRPQFMILCNFDEFWIYDLNTQLNDPVHILKTENLAKDYGALAFLFPTPEKPIFNNNNVEVTEEAAKIVGAMYLSLQKRKIDPHQAQRFVLQLVVALFAEDVGLIPKYTLQKILREAVKNPVTQKELTDLFQAMATDSAAKKTKKYKDIPYFNGGLFNQVDPVELKFTEIDLLAQASDQDWSKVRPSIFGAIFESSMDQDKRHGHGIHFTSELDIQKIVNPTIVRPFRERIEKAKNKKELVKILEEIQDFKVLDPACGSGNFLYIAFRELRRLEIEIYERMEKNFNPKQMRFGLISPKNFYGIDTNEFGLELAKVALCIGRKLSADEFGIADNVLPFDNLDENFSSEDALFAEWPETDVIIGNPPFLSSKFMKVEYPVEYVDRVREQFKEVPGRADYCVYWFRKAHDNLKQGHRAGLVGTNTIRQNYSREGGLDYITGAGGTITEAVSTQVWSGDASVHVSIVNWIKGEEKGTKRLFTQLGDKVESPWQIDEVEEIPANLTAATEVSDAVSLDSNSDPKRCFVGQAPQSEGFYLSKEDTDKLLRANKVNREVIFPFLIGRELLSKQRRPKRFVVDFGQKNILEAKKYKDVFEALEQSVFLDVKRKAADELKKSKKEGDWNNHLKIWWRHWRNRPDLISELNKLSRFVAVSRVTKRPIFEFVSSKIHPGDALVAFTFSDDYSFGILQSAFHQQWFKFKCSTLKGDWRYTGETVFETFPWPQSPTTKDVKNVASAAIELRLLRNKVLEENGWGLKDLYATLDSEGKNPLKDAHTKLDEAVATAYGCNLKTDILKFLMKLNQDVATAEKSGEYVQKPGLPQCIKDSKPYISNDCIEP